MDSLSVIAYYFVLAVSSIWGINSLLCQDPEIVTRDEWGARPPTQVENMTNPVSYVVIHHSYIPAACYSKEDCIKAMQWMQDYHQFNHSWNDIGYSFAAGSDNRIYIGRGWSAVGAHAPGYNNRSIGFCVIGDWGEDVPPEGQLSAVKQMIKKGIREGYIQENYKLIGHRQVRDTECPGDALYKEIQTWSQWAPDPTSVAAVKPRPIGMMLKENLKLDPPEDKEIDIPSEQNKLKRHSLEGRDSS
jgi:N-acetylmuramoyl-L-alanine amidase